MTQSMSQPANRTTLQWGGGTFTMYSTPWCGYCHRLKGQRPRRRPLRRGRHRAAPRSGCPRRVGQQRQPDRAPRWSTPTAPRRPTRPSSRSRRSSPHWRADVTRQAELRRASSRSRSPTAPSAQVSLGRPVTVVTKVSRSSVSRTLGRTAVTVAVRGTLRSSATSPKASPGPSRRTSRPPIVTSRLRHRRRRTPPRTRLPCTTGWPAST